MDEMPIPMQGQSSSAADARRLACIAFAKAAGDLVERGFDQAEADGVNLVARHRGTTWRVTNQVTSRPGVRGELRDRFDAAVMRAFLTRLPTEPLG